MKHTADALALALMTVIVSSLTVYGALGVDPFVSKNALSTQSEHVR